jgi:probable F420-dependent oxidoreductase
MTLRVRFGVTVAPRRSPEEWRNRVRALDDGPFDVLLVNDHLSGLRFAPLPALAAAAVLTDRIRLGTLVLANDFRHPTILAKEIATLDVLSGGRLEVGIGTGWMRLDYDQAGLSFDPPGLRLARLRETIDVLRGAWGDAPFTYEGEHYRADGLDLEPRPRQRPHPPILMGGGGPVMLRLAARQADIVNLTTRTAADGRGVHPGDVGLAPLLSKLDLVREAAGPERWSRLEISVGIRATAIDRPLGRVHPAVAAQVDALRGTPYLLSGDVDEVAAQILWVRTHRISYFTLGNDEEAESMYPVIEQVRAELARSAVNGGGDTDG